MNLDEYITMLKDRLDAETEPTRIDELTEEVALMEETKANAEKMVKDYKELSAKFHSKQALLAPVAGEPTEGAPIPEETKPVDFETLLAENLKEKENKK